MIDLLIVAIVSTFYVFSGWYLTYLLPAAHKVERVGLSFLLGAGFTTFIWFIGYRLGLPFTLFTLLLSGVVVFFTGFIIKKLFNLVSKDLVTKSPTKYEKILGFAIVALLTIALVIALYNPLTAWDAIALYDFRAHAISLNHDLRDITSSSYYVSYPLMISLVHASLYMLGASSAQGMHTIFFMALIAVVYGRMYQWTTNRYALIACLMIVLQNEIFSHATFAYTNLPYTAYLISGLLYAANPTLIISASLIALSTWMRSSEIFWIVALIIIAVQSIKAKKYLMFVSLTIFILLIRYSWSSFLGGVLGSIGQSAPPRVNYFTLDALAQIMSNTREIFSYIYRFIIYPYIGFWFLALPIALISVAKRNLRLVLLVAAILVSAAMVVVGIMIFSTYYDTWNEIGDSARRMILFIIPLTIIASTYALYLSQYKGSNDK